MDVVVPRLGALDREARLARWLKQPGDPVAAGEPIAELETALASLEIVAPAAGILRSHAVPEGATVPVGGRLAVIAGDGAEAETPDTVAPPAPPAPKAAAPAGRQRPAIRLPAVPVVEPLVPMRARVAETVRASRQTIPSFSLDRFVSLAAAEAARAALAPAIERDAGVRISLTDFLLQALADTLAHQPRMLAQWTELDGKPARRQPASADIGLVVATDDGMMIPVVRDLAGKSLAAIAGARQAAVRRVRSGRLIVADGEPAPLALSNLARGGADRFDAIIAPGSSSVLAVGRERDVVVARDGVPAVVRGVQFTLTVDHRLIDGMLASTFLGLLAERFEEGPWTAD